MATGSTQGDLKSKFNTYDQLRLKDVDSCCQFADCVNCKMVFIEVVKQLQKQSRKPIPQRPRG